MPAQRALWKRVGFAFISLTVALAALSPLSTRVQVAHATGPYVVDATLDAPDTNLGDHICDDGVGDCTLRAAIQQANNDIGPTTISFANALAGQTFVLTDTYGALLWTGDNITVTGGLNNITISGASLGAGKSIFTIEGNHNLLENLTVKRAPQDGVQIGDFDGVGAGNHNNLTNVTLLQNGASGVYVFGGTEGGQFNTIQNSRIGSASFTSCGFGNGIGVTIDQGAYGTSVNSSFVFCNTGRGVQVLNSSNVSVLGDAIGIYYNALLGNGGDGIYADGTTGLFVSGDWISDNSGNGITLANSTQAHIQANYIGTNSYASIANPNSGNGIQLGAGSNRNLIGGLALVDRNTISGNGLSGVLLDGSGTQTNTVVGNYIGTNLSGTAAIANGQNGVRLQNTANNNIIGGHGSTNVRNLISGNNLDGILLWSGAALNYIDGNFIGLGADGLTAIPNRLGGVALFGAPFNGIGGGYSSTTQYISGNGWQGIDVDNSDSTTIGESNNIGLAGDNVTPLGNGKEGVLINETINATVAAHSVLYNAGAGVALTGADSQNDKIAPTYVAFNGGLPVDLGEDGATANDAGDGDGGPNTLLNYPAITSYAGSVITGTVCASCTVLIYNAYGNPAGAYGGGYYIQSAIANGAGHWSATLIGGLHRIDISLVACQSPCGLASNTSEMSPRPTLFLPLARR